LLAASRPALFSGNGLEDEVAFASHERSFVDDDGIQLNGHGLWPLLLDDGDEPFWISYESPSLEGRSDLLHLKVAGIKYRELSTRLSTAGNPGEGLRITPEPRNPKNKDAHAIYASNDSHLGYVYDDDLGDVRTALAQGWVAVSAWEWRYENGERCAMHVLVVPPHCVTSLRAASQMTALP
jgi:HIRAN domain